MKNYKECSDDEFNEAMAVLQEVKNDNSIIKSVPTPQLYILYTKMDGDLNTLSRANGSYAIGLRISTQQTKEMLKMEMLCREDCPEKERKSI